MRITRFELLKKTAYLLGFLLLFLLLATGALWWKLGQGITIAHIDKGPVAAKNLFIQYDQGIIVRSDLLKVTESSATTSRPNLDSIIPHIKKWGHLIREIDIKQLKVKGQEVAVAYRHGSFYVTGDNYTIEAAVTHKKKTFHLELEKFEIIPYRVSLAGRASYSSTSDRFLFSGAFKTPWVNGALVLSEQSGDVTAEISTDQFTDLGTVLEQFPIDENIVNWVSDNITARQYRVNKLSIQFSLKEESHFGPENIWGSAVADSATIRFHDDLEPVLCEKIHISFKNDRLSFALVKPVYKDKSLDGSSVYIDKIIGSGSQLVINIKTVTQQDSTIENILNKYDIFTIARQNSGLTKADLNLTFTLPEFELSTNGTFTTGQGEWSIQGLQLHTEGTTVLLQDNLITIQQADISYRDILHCTVDSEVDLSSHRATLLMDINSLDYKLDGTPILSATGLKVPCEINYDKKRILVTSPEFNTSFTHKKKYLEVKVNSLKTVRPLVPLLKNLPYTEGNLHLTSNDLTNFDFNGTIDIPNEYLSRKDAPVNVFDFAGTFQPGKTALSLNEKSITASITDKIYVNLHDNLITVDTNNISTDDTPRLPFPLYLRGEAARIKLKKDELITKNFQLILNDSDLDFMADLEQGKIHYRHSSEGSSFAGKDLDAQLAENFMQSAELQDGRLNVNLIGDEDGYNGYMEITNVLFKDYLVLNNVFAFLNAIPALATFSSTGFDSEGYRINDAVVLFDVQDKLLTIRQLQADGITVDGEAHGWIDFKERTLDIKIKLITLKDYSKILDRIPLVGYAILGKDGKLSTSLDIKGNLDDPEVTTYLTEDILMTPFKIIKRTIKWPFKLFDDLAN